MLKNIQEITRQRIDKGLNTYKNIFELGPGNTPEAINVVYNNDGSRGKRLGSSTTNAIALESTAGFGMYDFGVLGVGGNDNNARLLLHADGMPVVDSSVRAYTITTYGNIATSTIKSKFGAASLLFAAAPGIDYMEYSSDANAQAAYVTNAVGMIAIQQTTDDSATGLGDVGGSEYRPRQSFTLTGTNVISQIKVTFGATNGSPAGQVTCRIETDDGGSPNFPTGTLAHANATITFTPTASAENTINFTDFQLAGGVYWIVLNCDNQSADNFWRVRISNSGGYEGGKGKFTVDGTWNDVGWDIVFKVYTLGFQSYSEGTIKQQGDYSLKAIANITGSLTNTLIRTLTASDIIDLREQDTVSFYLYSSRTGSNIRLGLRNTNNLVIMQTTPYIVTVNSWHAINWNISAFAANSKDGIDQIIFTIMEDSANNTFYVDSITSGAYKIINKSMFLTAPYNADWTTPGGLGNFTIDNQINFNFVTSSQVLIGQGSNSTNYWHLVYNTAAANTVNGFYFQAYSGGALVINLSGFYTPNTGSFVHYELVRNTTNNWYFFVNGSNIFVTGTTAGLLPGSGSLLKMGVNVVNTNNAYLCAFVDEWRYSNNARHISNFVSPTVSYNSDIIQERRLLCASGTGIYYSSDIGKTFSIAQTNRTAAINYFGFIKDYVINTNESYDPPQYWAGTAAQYFANISTATPACKHSFSHQGFAILLNESANKTGFYYVDQNSIFNSAWSNFKLPTARNDELTAGFSLGRTLYISSKYKIFRLDYIGGNPDWEYVDVKDWGFVPKTVRRVNIQGMGEAVIGLDWSKKIRIFFGSDDEVLSDPIAKDNAMTPFYLDNISAVDLNKCWAEDDRKAGVYRLFVAYANSSTVSYSINFNYRAGSLYAENNRPYQSGVLTTDTADNQLMMGCNYNGKVVIMDSGNTEAGTAIDEYHTSSFIYNRSPSRVNKKQQVDLFLSATSSGTFYYEDRHDFSNVWHLHKSMTLVNAISSVQIRHTIDLPETSNVYQFKFHSSANTADPWNMNLVDLSFGDLGVGKG